MQHALRNVLVFKTTVHTTQDVKKVAPLLNQLLHTSTDRWNFDLQDCDRILRIEAEAVSADEVIDKLRKAGFACAELED